MPPGRSRQAKNAGGAPPAQVIIALIARATVAVRSGGPQSARDSRLVPGRDGASTTAPPARPFISVACALTPRRCLRSDTLEEGARWLVAGILVSKLTLEGPLQDGLAEAGAARAAGSRFCLEVLGDRQANIERPRDVALFCNRGERKRDRLHAGLVECRLVVARAKAAVLLLLPHEVVVDKFRGEAHLRDTDQRGLPAGGPGRRGRLRGSGSRRFVNFVIAPVER